MAKCDRCGKEQKSLHDLALYKTRKGLGINTWDDYKFKVCDECAHDLFAWVGGGQTAKTLQTRPVRVACPKCGTPMLDI